MTRLAEVVGANIKRLRTNAGATQDGLAAACKRQGLHGWAAVRVAQCESGKSLPALPTLILLTAALDSVSSTPVALADLLQTEESVEIAPGVLVSGERIVEAVRGGAGSNVLRDAIRIGGVTADPGLSEVRSGWTRADTAVCKSLGMDREIGERIMADLWGRSLSAERDTRAEPNVRSRGLVTKTLTAEMRAGTRASGHAETGRSNSGSMCCDGS